MSRKSNRQTGMRARIAATAARIMAEDGIEDFALAKRKAARRLGASEAQALPGNDEIEAELRSYRALYQADEHPLRIAELRRIDRKSTRLNSSHGYISYAVFCLKKKKNNTQEKVASASRRR